MKKLTFLFSSIVFGSLLWFGYWGYIYLLDENPPAIILRGITEDASYAGEIGCSVEGIDSYKVRDISIWLDEKPLVSHHPIHKRLFKYAFTIPTQQLAYGSHLLKVHVVDGSWHANQAVIERSFYVDNVPLQAAFISADANLRVFQGRTLHVQVQTNKANSKVEAHAIGRTIPCYQENENSFIYDCYMPVKSDEQPNEYVLTIIAIDAVGNRVTLEQKFHVVMYPFKKQRLSIPQATDTVKQDAVRTEKELEEAAATIAQQSKPQKLWHGVFYVPCDMQGMSTEFGTIRTSQERGKYRHDAVDLLAPPRSVVWASQDGLVALKDTFEHSGKTVAIDHGCGIVTLYFHLDDFADIEVGAPIKKGKPIGKLGKTGYAKGYHLHWELRVNNIAIDPMEWTKATF